MKGVTVMFFYSARGVPEKFIFWIITPATKNMKCKQSNMTGMDELKAINSWVMPCLQKNKILQKITDSFISHIISEGSLDALASLC